MELLRLPPIDELQALLKPRMIVHHFDDSGVLAVRLKEDKEPKCYVDLRNIPNDALIIRADRFPAPNKAFKANKRCCCRADFILVSKQMLKVVFIELKCGTAYKPAHVTAQLKGAVCFFEYCQSMLNWFFETSDAFQNFDFRFVCLIRGTNKEPTTPKLSPNKKPEQARYIFRPVKADFNSMIA